MDDDARSAARRRAWIAFGLAGVLLVVNVVAAFAWRDERRDRLDSARIEVERRLDERFGDDGPWGRGDRDDSDGRMPGRDQGRMPGGVDGDRQGPRGDQFPGGPGGPDGAAPDQDQDGQDGGTQDGGDGQGGTA